MNSRWILHADLDAFFASVEQLDDPRLRGRPVVVGGAPEGRGVVAAASYEARRFGIHSAMPMSRALRLCPQLVRVSPRFDRYAEMSRQVMAIFRSLTALVEPMSLDEAYLDITDVVGAEGDVEAPARDLKRRVREATGLALSVGAGTNKTVAKIASDRGKPDGLVVVPAGGEAAFLAPLPVRTIPGVGPKTQVLLERHGIRTAGDLAAADAAQLHAMLGVRGDWLLRAARGEDEGPVVTEHERRSISVERTFPRDLPPGPDLQAALEKMAAELARHMAEKAIAAGNVAVKLRYANFRTITRQRALAAPVGSAAEIERVAVALLEQVTRPGDRFRLLGIRAASLSSGEEERQQRLWTDPPASPVVDTASGSG